MEINCIKCNKCINSKEVKLVEGADKDEYLCSKCYLICENEWCGDTKEDPTRFLCTQCGYLEYK